MQDSRPKEFEERQSIRIYQSVRLDRWAFELPTINKRIKPMFLRAGLVSATDRCLQGTKYSEQIFGNSATQRAWTIIN